MLGFLNIYKPSGITSSKVVTSIRKRFNIKKIGHMGTLDPMACGVLPIAIGKATRMFDYFLDKVKTYRTIFEFGYTTDTLDKEGIVLEKVEKIPTVEEIEEAIQSFLGKISQVPPQYSAKSIKGTRAYKFARQGVEVDIPAKIVEILDFRLIKQIDKKSFEFIIICSSGTYIRSLARDLGKSVKSLGCMSFLERIESGVFNLENSIPMDDLLELEDISSITIPVVEVFPKFDTLVIDEDMFTKVINGQIVQLDKPINKNTFILNKERLVGVARKNIPFLKIQTNLME